MGVQVVCYWDFSVPERRRDETNSEIGVWAVQWSRSRRWSCRGRSGRKHVIQEPGCQVPDINEEREVGGGESVDGGNMEIESYNYMALAGHWVGLFSVGRKVVIAPEELGFRRSGRK